MANQFSTEDQDVIRSLADSFYLTDPDRLCNMVFGLRTGIDGDLRNYLIVKLAHARNHAVEGNQYQVAYKLHDMKLELHDDILKEQTSKSAQTKNRAEKIRQQEEDFWLDKIKNCALTHGDHKVAFEYHAKRHNIAMDETNTDQLDNVIVAAKDAVWLEKIKYVATEKGDFPDFLKYTRIQMHLLQDHPKKQRQAILACLPASEVACKQGNIGAAAEILREFQRYMSDYTFKNTRKEDKKFLAEASDILQQLQQPEAFHQALEVFRSNYSSSQGTGPATGPGEPKLV